MSSSRSVDIILVGQLFSRIRADVSDDLERLNELWGQVDSFFAAELRSIKRQNTVRIQKKEATPTESLCMSPGRIPGPKISIKVCNATPMIELRNSESKLTKKIIIGGGGDL